MKTNLRRAHQIRSLIESHLVQYSPLPLTLYVTEEAVGDKIAKYQADLATDQARAQQLEIIVGTLRKTINAANHAAGLDDLLRQQASAKREVNRVAAIVGLGGDGDGVDTLLSQLKQAKFRFQNPGGAESVYSRHSETVSGYPIPKTIVDTYKDRLIAVQRTIRKISDDLLSINYNTQVEVSDEDIAYLENQRII